MPERGLHELRVKKLLDLDPEVNVAQLEEIRMLLNDSIEALEQKTARTRRRVLIALAVYLVGTFICYSFVVFWSDAAPNSAAALMKGLIIWPFVIATLAGALTGIWAAALYTFKYAPQLNRARFDAHTSMMLELQQQVRQFQEQMDRQDQ